MKNEKYGKLELENIEDEDLKCSICHYYFTKNLKPYSLYCCHNFCFKCIEALIEKNMLNCPICRRSFNSEDKNNFKINENFLELVTKILEYKFIFCIKCKKVCNFIEHFESCDQINFKDSHEIFVDIFDLARESIKILQSSDKHINILKNSEISIYEEIHRILKIININFFEFFTKSIDKFIEGIPKINVEIFIEEIFIFLKNFELFVNACNQQSLDIQNGEDNYFCKWLKIHINKIPTFSIKNGQANLIDDNDKINEILKYNFSNFKNFKEILKSINVILDQEKLMNSDYDSDYDFINFNKKKNSNKFNIKPAHKYKQDSLKQLDKLFSKNKNHNIDSSNINDKKDSIKKQDSSSIQFNNKEIQYSDEDIDEILKNENLPFKVEYNNQGHTDNPLKRDDNTNKKNSNPKNLNNNIKHSQLEKIKNNNDFKKGYPQKLFNEFQDKYLNKKNELAYNSNNSVKNIKNNDALSNSIDHILINNFNQNQIKFKNAKKIIYNGLNTERKILEGENSNKNFEFQSIKSESADPTFRSYDKNFITKIEKNSFNLNNRRFTNFSDNSNNTYKIENYNQFEYFNHNFLNDSFSCSSDDYINFVKRKNNRDQIKKIDDNLNTKNKKLETNKSKNFYKNSNYKNDSNTKYNNKSIKNDQNFSFKNSNKKISHVLNDEERNYIEITPNKIDFLELSNNSKKNSIQKEELNEERFEEMLKNIKISKDLEKDFRKIGIGEFNIKNTSFKKGIRTKEQEISKVFLTSQNLIHEPKEKESNFNLRQKIIVRNDKVKIIHNENINKENDKKENQLRQLTPSKIEIKQNKIRLVSNSPNINNSNIQNDVNVDKSINNNSQNHEFDQKSNNNVSEGTSNNTNSLNHKYCFGNNGLVKMKEKKEKRNSLTKLIDMNALFYLSKNSSTYNKKNFKELIPKQSPELYSIENQSNFANVNSTKNINKINKSIFEIDKETFKLNLDKRTAILSHTEKDVTSERLSENNFNIAEIKKNENNKYNKFLNNPKCINSDDNNIFDNLINNRKSMPKNSNNLSNSINEFPEKRFYNVIYTENSNINNLSNKKIIIGRDFKLSNEKYYSNYNNIRLNKSLSNIGDVTEFSNERNDEFANENNNSNNISEERSYDLNHSKTEINKENKLIDNKNFDSFKESQLTKDIDIYETYLNLLNNFNNIQDKILRISNYSTQIELTTETLRDQISKNYSHLSDKITSNLKGLCDNIVGINSKNNYYKRIIPNILENSKKICLFDIRLQTFEIKEFEYLTIKLNVSISIEHDGSDLIFLSGGKVNNSINFFRNEENFGDLSGQTTAMFLILRWSTKAIELNGQLLRKRAWHSSLFYNNKLYIIGGASSETNKLKECECYNLIEKQWELLPNLNYARCSPGLCIYNQEYLYVFNGWTPKDCFLDTIEFINIKDFSNNTWITYKPEDPGLCWEGFSNCCAAVVGENKILIFGGYKNENENKTYFFDPCKKIVYRGKDLIKPSIFYNNGLYFENKIYSLDNKNENRKMFGVHIYDITSNTWKYYLGPQ